MHPGNQNGPARQTPWQGHPHSTDPRTAHPQGTHPQTAPPRGPMAPGSHQNGPGPHPQRHADGPPGGGQRHPGLGNPSASPGGRPVRGGSPQDAQPHRAPGHAPGRPSHGVPDHNTPVRRQDDRSPGHDRPAQDRLPHQRPGQDHPSDRPADRNAPDPTPSSRPHDGQLPPVALGHTDLSHYDQSQIARRQVDDFTADENTLFRGTQQTPDEVRRASGFAPPVQHGRADILKHIEGDTNRFVSTSTEIDKSLTFSSTGEHGYLYRIKAPGGILSERTQDRMGHEHTRYGEGEVLFAGGIDWRYVEGWHKVVQGPDGKQVGEFVPNPDFIGRERKSEPETPDELKYVPPPEPPPIEMRPSWKVEEDEAREAAERGEVPSPEEKPAEAPQEKKPAPPLPVDVDIQARLGGEPARPAQPAALHAGQGDESSQQRVLQERFPGIEQVNAHRLSEDGHRTNCVEAMIADERRYHGEQVEARPTRPEDVPEQGRLSRVRDALGGEWTSHKDFDSVTRAMASTPENSRGALAYRFTDEEGRTQGHVVRVVNTPDGVAYADPQTGRLATLPDGATDVRLLSEDYTDDTAHSHVDDDGGYGATPEEQRDDAVDQVADDLGISDPEKRQALADTYDAAREYTAPIVVDVAARIHDDLEAITAADPDHRVVFLGRDGHSLALASRELDPAFFDRHASEVVLSRAVVEAALRDVERSDPDRDLSAVDEFRLHKKVADEDVPGAYDRLSDYLDSAGVPIHGDGGISLVDTSYKGTVQEMLTAAYPDPRFQGHYAFHGQSPGDPHPDAKKGYLVDLEPEDGGGKPLRELPDDPGRTFAHQDAIGVIEETLHGTMSSPRRIDESGPVQQPQRFEPDPAAGINPLKVAEPFQDPAVREGAKAMSLRAVVDVAREMAELRAEGGAWRDELSARAEHGRDQVRSWVAEDGSGDPRFREVMDSLVRRGDKGAVAEVEAAVRDLPPDEQRRVWTEFAARPGIAERVEYARVLREGKR
ncbi:scabin-related ADP-ribosyltransferase [Lentzea flaviverrucosa]|uniref:scabin-related ADP-ribosyltransferase n=1 Tax=Lentzea flaviverrucosa TaxID=200379 RepID=UPI001477775D|nr:toxin glutamine deamidase domain-containing protein [Lentzea flaviverrucosa]